jgi:hypothetical protein
MHKVIIDGALFRRNPATRLEFELAGARRSLQESAITDMHSFTPRQIPVHAILYETLYILG